MQVSINILLITIGFSLTLFLSCSRHTYAESENGISKDIKFIKFSKQKRSTTYWSWVKIKSCDSISNQKISSELTFHKVQDWGSNSEIFYRKKVYHNNQLLYKTNRRKSKTYKDGKIFYSSKTKHKEIDSMTYRIEITKHYNDKGKFSHKDIDTSFQFIKGAKF